MDQRCMIEALQEYGPSHLTERRLLHTLLMSGGTERGVLYQTVKDELERSTKMQAVPFKKKRDIRFRAEFPLLPGGD